MAQLVKNLPAVWETWVQSLGREDPLEKEMATHSSILAWRIPWKEESVGLQSMGWQRVGHNCVTFINIKSDTNLKCGRLIELYIHNFCPFLYVCSISSEI